MSAKSPFGCCDQLQAAKLGRVAQEGEVVLAAPASFELRGVREEQARLTDEVERDVREPEVLFEGRRMPDPPRELLAQDEARVRQAQHVLRRGARTECGRGRHSVFTSSGMS